MISVRPCTLEDMHAIMGEVVGIEGLPSDFVDEIADETFTKWCRTICEDGEPIATMGVFPKWAGVGVAWAWLPAEALDSRPVAVGKIAKRLLSQAFDTGEFRRVEATVDLKFWRAQEWIEMLGFRVEGLMEHYGPGGEADHYMYARLE